MSLQLITPCCSCADHQRPHVNEDGWILTGLVDDPSTWEAWRPAEWRRHCQWYTPGELRIEIARRKLAGEKVADLAEEYGIDPRTVLRYCRKYREAA